MRSLFILDHKSELTISPEAYTLIPFKKIWDRDKSKDKKKALMDLAYIFWFTDFRSYVGDITDTDEKNKEIISIIDEEGKYKPDDLIFNGIELYAKDLPLSLKFLDDVKSGINELRKYFRDLDLTEKDNNGKLVHNANQVMSSVSRAGDLLSTIEKLELKVKKDLDQEGSARGDKQIGMYEN